MQRIAPKKQDELRCSNEPEDMRRLGSEQKGDGGVVALTEGEGTGGSVVQKTKSIVVFI
jgi:hypothetical protein